ncbi:10232_t:CDS:1 [Cetraspora pellucida]|uniref:10232_t:CDS:1 n=1 Tax=Cetraspora pellucida TaxID=1433469 RepID=A0ACA9L1J3_9GLOM|nr:10232_t:CDS:1 [Cetraspora pellucida]
MKQARRTEKISNLNVNLSQSDTSKSDNLSKGYRINSSCKSNEFQEKFKNYEEFKRFKNYEEFRGFENYEEFREFENYKEFEHNKESNYEENDNFSESRTYYNVSSEEDTDIDVDDKADDQVNSIDSWRCLVEQWLLLIKDEDDADDDSMLNE